MKSASREKNSPHWAQLCPQSHTDQTLWFPFRFHLGKVRSAEVRMQEVRREGGLGPGAETTVALRDTATLASPAALWRSLLSGPWAPG